MTLQIGCRAAPPLFTTKASSHHVIGAQAAEKKGELSPRAASVSR